MDMPLSGDIREYSLPAILVCLKEKKATGTLSVTHSMATKSIYIKDGDPIFASSSVEEDRLGNMLVKAGKISIEQYERSSEILRKTGRRHGAILAELGYLTPKELLWGVKYQVANIIYSMFILEEGAYIFDDGAIPESEVITLKMRMGDLVYKSVKRFDNLTRVRREMPEGDRVFMLNKEPSRICGEIDLSAQDRKVLSLVDGRRTITELTEEAGHNSFEVMKTLYVLWLTGFIIEKAESVQPESDEEMLLRKKADEFYEGLGRMSEAEILQIDRSADSATVKRSYYRLAKEFHPDRCHNSGDRELQARLAAIFNAATNAYKLLKDDVKRREYFDSVKGLRGKGRDSRGVTIEEQFGRGINELKKRNYEDAAAIFRWVSGEDPKNPNAWSYLSQAFSNIPHRLKDAEKALLEAIRLEPFNSRHFSDLGNIYRKAGIVKRAQQQFEKALKLDPGNADAKEGLDKITVSTNSRQQQKAH